MYNFISILQNIPGHVNNFMGIQIRHIPIRSAPVQTLLKFAVSCGQL